MLELNSPLRGYLATFISPRALALGRTNSRTARTTCFVLRAGIPLRGIYTRKKYPLWGIFSEKLPPMGVKILSLREKNTPYGVFSARMKALRASPARKKYPLWGIFPANISSKMKKIPPMQVDFR